MLNSGVGTEEELQREGEAGHAEESEGGVRGKLWIEVGHRGWDRLDCALKEVQQKAQIIRSRDLIDFCAANKCAFFRNILPSLYHLNSIIIE